MGVIITSGLYDIAGVGEVRVNVRRDARSVRARWKDGRICVTAPMRTDIDWLGSVLRDMMPRLQQIKPTALYQIGQHIETPELSVAIERQSKMPQRIVLENKHPQYRILVGDDWDLSSAQTIKGISRMLCQVARINAPSILLPLARQIAQDLDCHPAGWSISSGHRLLGKCRATREIELSYALIYYPETLRRYVICHELAHLTHMNHSMLFHQLCDIYCQGQERKLQSELRRFRSPLL